jgi:isoleucyl-tRNA synthetase
MFEGNQRESFPDREKKVLDFWQSEKIFEMSLEQRRSCPLFSTYDGPPFATGLPHYGHILAGTIKDVIPRYKTMKGFYVPRRFGWDCHGLPVENEIEKAQQLSGASAIETYGIAAFNEECRGIVLRYTEEWKTTVARMGRWVDLVRTYRTMDPQFMESVWWVFAGLYAKGLVYEGFKVMPFSAQLGTPLSNFEANLNYKDVDDPSLTVTFPLEGDPDTSLLVWTTTPWTLPSNLAIGVHPNLEYVKIKDRAKGCFYIIARARLEANFKNAEDYEIVSSFLGETLKGRKYQPMFPYFVSRHDDNGFRVLLEEAVSSEDGTGLLHMAPAFGEVDFFACQKAGIGIVCPVDQNGRITEEVPDFAGLFVKDADREIIKKLKNAGRVFKASQIRHRYPFCWRSDTPLIYKAVRTWFVAVEKIKDKMVHANNQIHWVPEHIKDGRFGKWLENARDWAISRNRYWGTPIPLWRSADGEIIVISSIKELEERVGKKISDIHRHYIDDLTFVDHGKEFRRIPEVFDCWFESGSMPYAQNHFPFENEKETLEAFPADFIAEGLDQTRGWFYTLTVLAAALFDRPAFRNCIVNGIILAEDGAKMSKRLKNYPEPGRVFDQYGADALRLYLLSSPAVCGEDLKFSERGVELVMRQVLIPLWNSYLFLSTYAKIYAWKPSETTLKDRVAPIDRWILSHLQKLTRDVTHHMDHYHLNEAVAPLVAFIDQLTNWYIRRSRPRFWADESSLDRTQAFETLHFVLITLTKVIAPFVPFIAEAIYLQLREEKDLASVHLCDFPTYQSDLRDEVLEREMHYVQTVVSNGHALRKEHKLKVRQPLAKAFVVSSNQDILDALEAQRGLIAEELNVKEVVYSTDEAAFVTWVAKPNFRILGKKVGKLMNSAQKVIQGFDRKQLQSLQNGMSLEILVEGERITLTPEDVGVERQVRTGLIAASAGEITVGLDTELNEELLLEGLAREIVNKINTMRRDEGFEVVDRILVSLDTTERVKRAFELHEDYITHEILATGVAFEPCEGAEWDLNGESARILIKSVVAN